MEHEPLTVSTLQLGDLAGILRRRIKLIAVTTLAVLALAVTYLLLATPQYTAFTEILIDPRKKNTVENEVIPSGLGTTASDNFALVDSQVRVITSDAVLRPVVKSQDLVADPEFNGTERSIPTRVVLFVLSLLSSSSGTPASPEDFALKELRKNIEVSRDNQTYVIQIAVTTRSPTKSADIARAIAASYLKDQSSEKIETTKSVSAQIDGQLATLRERLLKAESEVQKFRATHNLQLSENNVLIDTRQLQQLNEKLTEAQTAQAQTQAKYDQVRQLLRNGIDPEVTAEAINSSTITGLRDQYATAARREAILSASLLPSHPTMVQARSEVQRLRGLIRAEVERIAKAIKLENDAAKERLRAAEKALASSRQEANTNDSAYIKLRELEREAETTRTVYESFLSRVKQMNEAERVYTPDARVITPAAVPQEPSWPKKLLTLALALVFGPILGAALAIGRELFGGRTHSETELLTTTGLQPLISIPRLQPRRSLPGMTRRFQPNQPNLYDIALETLDGGPDSRFRAAIFSLLGDVMDLRGSGQPRIVMLTSALPREGKTAVALSLAVAAASSGIRTLLIDASSSNPMLTQMLGRGEAGPRYRDQVVTDAQLGLSFLSLEDGGQNTGGRVRTGELQTLAHNFELTIVDGGLLKGEPNTAPLMSISEAVLLVSQPSSMSPKAAASAASDLLDMAHGRHCAAVLTMANA